ncbi:MAG TPA: hypothetical protein VL988_12360 [Solirubrobacteraceae bacterium]|nr:hypothetical protein [Solirubrobacteraceae bacterium]
MAKARTTAIGTAALLSAATLAAGCGSDHGVASPSATPDYLAAVTRAAYTTEQVPGYKFALTTSVSLAGKSATGQGGGTIAEGGSQGTAGVEVEGTKVEEVIDKPYLYVRTPSAASSRLTHGKPWLRIDLSTFSQSLGSNSFGAGSSNPAEVLSYLRAAGTVTRVGEEQVRGVDSTRYHAVIYLGRFVSAVPPSQRAAGRRAGKLLERITGAKTLPMDVWVGGGRVTRISFTFPACTPEGRLQDSLSMDLYGYGPQPAVKPPPADQVADVDAQVKAQVQRSLAQLHCG